MTRTTIGVRRRHARRPRRVGDQRDLARPVARAERRDLLSAARDGRLALDDHEELADGVLALRRSGVCRPGSRPRRRSPRSATSSSCEHPEKSGTDRSRSSLVLPLERMRHPSPARHAAVKLCVSGPSAAARARRGRAGSRGIVRERPGVRCGARGAGRRGPGGDGDAAAAERAGGDARRPQVERCRTYAAANADPAGDASTVDRQRVR